MIAAGDDLFLGRLILDVDDGELMLVAAWWTLYDDVPLLTSVVLDCRETEN